VDSNRGLQTDLPAKWRRRSAAVWDFAFLVLEIAVHHVVSAPTGAAGELPMPASVMEFGSRMSEEQ
jgi:hypothetical protein